MRIAAPLIFGVLLVLAGCHQDSLSTNSTSGAVSTAPDTTQKPQPEIRSDIEQFLVSHNSTACIDGILYFTSFSEGYPIITGPVVDAKDAIHFTRCTGGFRHQEFGKL